MAETNKSKLQFLRSISTRIWFTAGFLILLSVATGYVGFTTSSNYRQDAEVVTDLAGRTIDVFNADVTIYKLVRAEKDFVLSGDDRFKNERIAFSSQLDIQLEKLVTNALSQDSKTLLRDIQEAKQRYDANFLNAVKIFEEAAQEKVTKASEASVITSADGEVSVLEPIAHKGTEEAFERVRALSLVNTEILLRAEEELISKVVGLNTKAINTTLEGARQRSQQVGYISLAAILAALIVGLLVAYLVIRSMGESLRSIVGRLGSLTDVLRDSVSQATDVATRNATTANQLASATTQQSKQAEAISSTISQTAQAITNTSKLAQDGSNAAGEVNTLSQEGAMGAEKAVKGLGTIGKIVSDAVDKIQNLSNSSEEVGDLASEVTGIADQINILALNAAIEAARAGEAGRGFAVVADEVRRLAEGSRKFADQITQRISSVVSRSKETAQSTAEGAKEIESSTETIQASLGVFKKISEAVGSATAKIQEISSTITQQATAAEQISKTTNAIAKGIDQNAAGAITLSDAVEQQKVVISVVQKSLEEAEGLLEDSRILVGLKADDVNKEHDEFVMPTPEMETFIPEPEVPEPEQPPVVSSVVTDETRQDPKQDKLKQALEEERRSSQTSEAVKT